MLPEQSQRAHKDTEHDGKRRGRARPRTGIHLAKREMRIVIEAFLSRMRNIRIAGGDSFAFHAGSTLGVDRLILEWEKA